MWWDREWNELVPSPLTYAYTTVCTRGLEELAARGALDESRTARPFHPIPGDKMNPLQLKSSCGSRTGDASAGAGASFWRTESCLAFRILWIRSNNGTRNRVLEFPLFSRQTIPGRTADVPGAKAFVAAE